MFRSLKERKSTVLKLSGEARKWAEEKVRNSKKRSSRSESRATQNVRKGGGRKKKGVKEKKRNAICETEKGQNPFLCQRKKGGGRAANLKRWPSICLSMFGKSARKGPENGEKRRADLSDEGWTTKGKPVKV